MVESAFRLSNVILHLGCRWVTWMDLTMEAWRGDLVGGKSYSFASIQVLIVKENKAPTSFCFPRRFSVVVICSWD